MIVYVFMYEWMNVQITDWNVEDSLESYNHQ